MSAIEPVDGVAGSSWDSIVAALAAATGAGDEASRGPVDGRASDGLPPGAAARPTAPNDGPAGLAAAPPGVVDAQARQGQELLMHMAVGPMAAAAVAVPVAPADAAYAAIPAPRPELMSVPVLVPPWQAPANERALPRRRPRRVLPRVVGSGADEDDAQATRARDGEADDDDRAAPGDRPDASPRARQLADWLRANGRADACGELAAGRRVLIVLPRGGAGRERPASVWMLTRRAAWSWTAVWRAAQGARAGWVRHGVARLAADATRLVSRPGSAACEVILGVPAPLQPGGDSACLVLPEGRRFALALGLQWSLGVYVAPPGVGPQP